MNSISLYDISNAFSALENEFISSEEQEKMKEEINVLLKEKSTSLIGLIQNEEATINAIEAEEFRLKELRKSKQNKLDRLEQYIIENMIKMDCKKIETNIGTITLAQNPPSVSIYNEDLIPNEFKKVKQEIVVDKKAILNTFKENGEMVEGTLIYNKNSLRIK